MIDGTSGVDKTLGVYLNKTYKISSSDSDKGSTRRDAVTISKFSELVERGRTYAMALPDIRASRVAEVKSSLAAGETPNVSDIASAMINSTVEGQV